jgi:predicted AlkP superfamily pyrophosphatase or phosphodiesterase
LSACTQNATSASDILKFWFSHLMFFIWDDLCVQVKDTVQVDHNVSRHLDAELAATDWDLLVLHYLGLDHVGHLGGRSSPLMPRKLKEMDAVVQKIHQSLTASTASRNTLLLVGSDHGMTDGGNHGGASYQETDSLALFILGTDKLNPSCDLHPQILSHNQNPNMGLSILTSYQVC